MLQIFHPICHNFQAESTLKLQVNVWNLVANSGWLLWSSRGLWLLYVVNQDSQVNTKSRVHFFPPKCKRSTWSTWSDFRCFFFFFGMVTRSPQLQIVGIVWVSLSLSLSSNTCARNSSRFCALCLLAWQKWVLERKIKHCSQLLTLGYVNFAKKKTYVDNNNNNNRLSWAS
jgi:hypothetical protein